MGWLVIFNAKEKMRNELKDCLRLLHIAHDIVEKLGWEKDFMEHMKSVFGIYREKLNDSRVLKRDVNALKKYLECINTFDKHKIHKRGEKILA
jgi:hypothetical protein